MMMMVDEQPLFGERNSSADIRRETEVEALKVVHLLRSSGDESAYEFSSVFLNEAFAIQRLLKICYYI